MLIARGADVNARGFEDSTPLYYAEYLASPRDEELIEFLKASGGSL